MRFEFGFPIFDGRPEAERKACASAARDRRSTGEKRKSKNGSAFTLLELLLSLALVGMLLVAMNQFIFSMGELWGRGADVRLFDRHVRAVTRFVEHSLHSTVLPSAKGEQALAIQEIRLPDGPTAPVLTFELPAGSHVLPWPETPLPDVVCAFAVRPDQGLVLYWHSRLELHFADDPPRATTLSPFVTALSYEYYNAGFNSWQNSTAPQRDNNGHWQVPTRLRLRFTYGKLTRETVVPLPATSRALPLF
jgi:prepilin-type N-terminal cleavage/methylation domain-containing protein